MSGTKTNWHDAKNLAEVKERKYMAQIKTSNEPVI